MHLADAMMHDYPHPATVVFAAALFVSSAFSRFINSSVVVSEKLCRGNFVLDLLQPAQRRSGRLSSVRRIWLGAGPQK